MDNRTCTGCGTEFTPTHGRQRCCSPACRKPNYAKVEKRCDWCGASCMKYRSSRQRYSAVYCSTACRDNGIRKVWPACPLPADHWARWYGSTSEWVAPQQRAAFFANQCDDCGERFIEHAYGVPSTYCSSRCARRVGKRKRRAREQGAPGDFTLSQVIRQYIRQGRTCAYCKQPCVGLPDPEHVLPLSRGGRNDMSNLVAACRPCNTDKSDLTLAEWAIDRERRGLQPVDTTLDSAEFEHVVHGKPTAEAWRHTLAA